MVFRARSKLFERIRTLDNLRNTMRIRTKDGTIKELHGNGTEVVIVPSGNKNVRNGVNIRNGNHVVPDRTHAIVSYSLNKRNYSNGTIPTERYGTKHKECDQLKNVLSYNLLNLRCIKSLKNNKAI